MYIAIQWWIACLSDQIYIRLLLHILLFHAMMYLLFKNAFSFMWRNIYCCLVRFIPLRSSEQTVNITLLCSVWLFIQCSSSECSRNRNTKWKETVLGWAWFPGNNRDKGYHWFSFQSDIIKYQGWYCQHRTRYFCSNYNGKSQRDAWDFGKK